MCPKCPAHAVKERHIKPRLLHFTPTAMRTEKEGGANVFNNLMCGNISHIYGNQTADPLQCLCESIYTETRAYISQYYMVH